LGIAARRISYGYGLAAWDSTNLQEGLPVREHFEPEPVQDSASVSVCGARCMPDSEQISNGALYYVAEPPLVYSHAHACLFLDKYFEDTVVGGPSNYDRIYKDSDIPGTPESTYINLWKRTRKAGEDKNLCLSNGIMTGFTINWAQGQLMTMTPRLAFAKREFLADPGDSGWALNRTDGHYAPLVPSSISCISGEWGVSIPETFPLALSFTLSSAFTPHFADEINPVRFSRGPYKLTGSITLRDRTDEVERYNGYLESGTPVMIYVTFSYFLLTLNFRLTSGGGQEDEKTRFANFGFEGITDLSDVLGTGFKLTLTPGRVLTP